MSRNMDELRQMLKEEAEEKAIQEANEPSTLLGKFFQEAGDDDENDEGENLEDIEKEMNDLDSDDGENEDDELGNDDSDVQNEYDEGELNTLNELIADEQHAMQAYFKAGKETKSVILSRLYNDIGAEEAFHSEQLLYAKAELTGEKYEPSDPEVKKEYEELLENGMDEETAMYTIADRHKLDAGNDEDDMEELEDIEKDMEELGESFSMMISGMELMIAVQESGAYKNNAALREAYCEYYQIVESGIFMEAMDNVATTQGSKILGTNNPFLIIGRAIKAVYMFIIDMVKKLKVWIDKRRIKSKRVWAWLKKHGIKGLFANGVKLYCWNDQTNQVEVSDYASYLTLLLNSTKLVAKKLGINEPNVTKYIPVNVNNSKVPVITNPKDAIGKINGVVFSKSKIVVTDANATELENMFFGLTEKKFRKVTDDPGSGEVKGSEKNINIYNALAQILEVATAYSKATDDWMPTVQNTITSPGNNAATKNPTIYKECVDLMKEIAKGYQRMIKCVNADISECMKLDKGLLAAVQQGEEGNQYGDAAFSVGPDGKPVPRMASKLN